MRNIGIFLILLGCCLSMQASGPLYASKKLKDIGDKLALTKDSIFPGSRLYSPYKSYEYVVEADDKGEVTHIGVPLFPSVRKEGTLTMLFNFTERYMLELLLLNNQQERRDKMKEDQTLFGTGSLSALFPLKDSLQISVSTDKQNRHRIEWKQEEPTLFSFSFPAQYELILGMDKPELEERLPEELKSTLIPTDIEITPDPEQLSATPQKEYYIHKGNNYQIAALSSDLYYKKEESNFRLLNDPVLHPGETLANIMLSVAAQEDYILEIEQVKYGNKKEHYSLSLKQWITYNLRSGGELYFGLESLSKESLTATVIMENRLLGYNHLLHFQIMMPDLEAGKGNIPAVLHTYIPIHNISDLFYENKDKLRKTLEERIQ